jgi:hypothetical protein
MCESGASSYPPMGKGYACRCAALLSWPTQSDCERAIANWHPELPLTESPFKVAPEEGEVTWALAATPGLSVGNLANLMGVSKRAAASYRAHARRELGRSSALRARVRRNLETAGPELGLELARLRQSSNLSFWSRLSMQHLHHLGACTLCLARAFDCSQRTVNSALTRPATDVLGLKFCDIDISLFD